jgi:hypothetical protein
MRAKKSVIRKLRRTSLTELAVLEMTNDGKDPTKSGSGMVTSKEAYVWAALMAHVVENRPEVTPEQLILAATSEPNIRRNLKFFYNQFPMGFGDHETAAIFPPDVIGTAIRSLHLEVKPLELTQSARVAYSTLVKRGWIEDPVEILVAGAWLSVMGFVPVSFTQKTKEGRKISKKIKALYWSYEKSETRGITTTNVEFRLQKMVKAFKSGIGAFKAAIQDDDDA